MDDPNSRGKSLPLFLFVGIFFFGVGPSLTIAGESSDTSLFKDSQFYASNNMEDTFSSNLIETQPESPLEYGWSTKEKLLFGSYAALQLADVITTKIAIDRGAKEVNPIFGSDPNLGIIVGAKLGITLGTWYLMDRVIPKGKKTTLLLILNTIMGAIVANNVTVAMSF